MQDKTIILIIFLICFLLVAAMAGFIAWILFAYQKKQNAFQAQLEIIKDNNEKEMLRTQLEMQEQTFQYISQEIHDNIGQFISLARLHLNTIDTLDNQSATQQIDYSSELLGKALDDLRDLSKSLSSELIKNAGLVKAIELQISQLRKANKYDVKFEVKGNYVYLEEQKEIIIFRIVQEAINNIIKHANANRIIISMICGSEKLIMHIQDNGKGFDHSVLSNNSNGISNMTRRAKLINAILHIESSDEGTVITLDTPYETIQTTSINNII